jgi:hypothetical protein
MALKRPPIAPIANRVEAIVSGDPAGHSSGITSCLSFGPLPSLSVFKVP